MNEHVLVVDDEPAIRDLLASQVSFMGYRCQSASNGTEALGMAEEPPPPALALVDLYLPDVSGLEVLRRLRQIDEYLQVVMVTANDNVNSVRHCLREGAYDYVIKPYDLEDLAQTVKRALERRQLMLELAAHQRQLADKVEAKTHEILQTRDIALLTLAKLAECRDDSTGYHLDRIQWYSRALAQALRRSPYHEAVTDEFVRQLSRSSQLHDIGKVAIPDRILLKPGPLTETERTVMRSHTTRGGDTLRQVIERYRGAMSQGARFLRGAMEIAYSHHERWDGGGYPQGLSGSVIPLSARIVAVADAYDAITSDRPYKTASGHRIAFDRICDDRGTHFDPVVVDCFRSCGRQLELIQRQMKRLEHDRTDSTDEEAAADAQSVAR